MKIDFPFVPQKHPKKFLKFLSPFCVLKRFICRGALKSDPKGGESDGLR